MTEDWIWKLLPIVALVAQGLFAWFMWSLSRKFMTCDACHGLRADYDKRLGCVVAEGRELQASLANLATVKDVHALSREVGEVRGGQEALRESVKSLAVSIDRIEKPLNLLLEYQINKGDQK